MITGTLLGETADAIAALDFSKANARLAEIGEEIAANETAISAADGRINEIAATMRERRDRMHPSRPDVVAVADRLLAGSAPGVAAEAFEDEPKLEAERQVLQAAVAELRGRIRGLEAEARVVRDAAKDTAMDPLQPLIAALHNQARELADELADVHLALHAIGTGTRTFSAAQKATQLAFDGLFADYGLLKREPRTVPVEINSLLAQFADKGPAVKIGPASGHTFGSSLTEAFPAIY